MRCPNFPDLEQSECFGCVRGRCAAPTAALLVHIDARNRAGGWSRPSDPRLALVASCPDRGSVLPHTLQLECGCGGELTECRAGRGKVAGRVTLRDCLVCVTPSPTA
jgi:hypothetical protein